MRVEVVYALPAAHDSVEVTLAEGSTVRDAIVTSGLLERHPEIDLVVQKCGVFGEVRRLDERVADGDRVEIYRPLFIDPKEARRRRARR